MSRTKAETDLAKFTFSSYDNLTRREHERRDSDRRAASNREKARGDKVRAVSLTNKLTELQIAEARERGRALDAEAAAGQAWIADLIAWADDVGFASPYGWALVEAGSVRKGGTVLSVRCHSGVRVTIKQIRETSYHRPVRYVPPPGGSGFSYGAPYYYATAKRATQDGWDESQEKKSSRPHQAMSEALKDMGSDGQE